MNTFKAATPALFLNQNQSKNFKNNFKGPQIQEHGVSLCVCVLKCDKMTLSSTKMKRMENYRDKGVCIAQATKFEPGEGGGGGSLL